MNNVKETGIITEVDRYLFGEGTHYEIYKKLGAHVMELNGDGIACLSHEGWSQ